MAKCDHHLISDFPWSNLSCVVPLGILKGQGLPLSVVDSFHKCHRAMNRWTSWPQGPKKRLCNRSPQMIIMTHRCSAHIITSSYHMQIYLQLSSHFGSAAICSFKSFVQKDSRFQSISEGLGVEMPQNFIMPSGLPTYKGFTWFSDFTWDSGLFRGWSLKKGAGEAKTNTTLEPERFPSRLHHQMRENVLIRVRVQIIVERKRRRIEWLLSHNSHFQTWQKMAFKKVWFNTVSQRPRHPRNITGRIQGMMISRNKRAAHLFFVQVDGGTHDRKWRRSWEVWGHEECGKGATGWVLDAVLC